MQILKTLAVVAGLFLAYQGYENGQVDVPDNPVPNPAPNPAKIEVVSDPETEKDYPPAPVGPLEAVSLPIRDVLLARGTPEDAIKLARVFRDWANRLSNHPSIQSTEQFQQAYLNATRIVFDKTLAGSRFGGELSPHINNVIETAFSQAGLTETVNGKLEVKNAEWDARCSQAAASAFNAVSHQCFVSFVNFPPSK